jgi:hypothetical protein
VAVVFDDTEYLVSPVGVLPGVGGFRADSAIIGQEFKSQPATVVDRVRQANANLAYGEEQKKGDLPFAGTLQVMGHQAAKVGAVPMPRRGTPIEVNRDLAAKEIPIMEMFKRLRSSGVLITPTMNAELRAELGESVPAGRADEVVRALADGQEWRAAGPLAEAM